MKTNFAYHARGFSRRVLVKPLFLCSAVFSALAIADPVPQWDRIGQMHSVRGDWSSPVWVVDLYKESRSDDGRTATVRFDFSAAPKCYPSLEDCPHKIILSTEHHTFRCDDSTVMIDGSIVWDTSYSDTSQLPSYYAGGVISLEKNSPLRDVVQPALCGSGGRRGTASSLADTGITVAVIAGGGMEMNPVGIPAKILGEAYGYSHHGTDQCVAVVSGVRAGGCIGTGATLGGLAGGPVGMAVGGLVGALSCTVWSERTARESCYGPVDQAYPVANNNSSFNSM